MAGLPQAVSEEGLMGNNKTQLISVRERIGGLAWSLGHHGVPGMSTGSDVAQRGH